MIDFQERCDYSIVLSTNEKGNKFVSVMQISTLTEIGVPILLLDTDGTVGVELLNKEDTYDNCHSLMTDLIMEAQKIASVQVLENPNPQGDKRFQINVNMRIPETESEIREAFDISGDNPNNLIGEKIDTDKYRSKKVETV